MSSNTMHRGWFKAAKSGGNGGQCVEANMDTLALDGIIRLRDSKNPDVAPFEFTRSEWTQFLSDVAVGQSPLVDDRLLTHGVVLLSSTDAAVRPFAFDLGEWSAFLDGVSKGEFALASQTASV